jgi:hypothetical protein
MSTAAAAPMTPPPARRSSFVKYLGVLVLGVVLGSSVTVVVGIGLVKHWVRTQADWPERATSRTARVLSLDREQRARVAGIFQRRFEAINAIRRENYPRLAAELDLMESEIAESLPAEKAQRWRGFFARMRSNFLVAPPASESPSP